MYLSYRTPVPTSTALGDPLAQLYRAIGDRLRLVKTTRAFCEFSHTQQANGSRFPAILNRLRFGCGLEAGVESAAGFCRIFIPLVQDADLLICR